MNDIALNTSVETARLAIIRADLLTRIGTVRGDIDLADFTELVERMARLQLKFERTSDAWSPPHA